MNTKRDLTGLLISLVLGSILFAGGCTSSQTPTEPG